MKERGAGHCVHEGEIDACILCGRCLDVCPLFRATGREELAPRAKFFTWGRRADPAANLDEEGLARLASLCLGCGRCEHACPQGLCAPDLMARVKERHPGFREWLWKTWLTRAGLLWPTARGVAGAIPDFLAGAVAGDAGRELKRRLEVLAGEPKLEPLARVVRYDDHLRDRPVLLFSGCTARHARPLWSERVAALLAGMGARLLGADELGCCGCSLGHAGARDVQRAMQRSNIEAWRRAGKPLIAAFCATCRCGLRSYASVDHDWEPFEREEWLTAVRPLSDLFGRTRFEAQPDGRDGEGDLLYHRPCHGRGGDHDFRLLRDIFGGRIRAGREEACCGFGGVMQLSRPELTRRVAADLWSRSEAVSGSVVVSGCSACVLQLAATAPEGVACGHWLEMLRP